jgi:hypothetical protein
MQIREQISIVVGLGQKVKDYCGFGYAASNTTCTR